MFPTHHHIIHVTALSLVFIIPCFVFNISHIFRHFLPFLLHFVTLIIIPILSVRSEHLLEPTTVSRKHNLCIKIHFAYHDSSFAISFSLKHDFKVPPSGRVSYFHGVG